MGNPSVGRVKHQRGSPIYRFWTYRTLLSRKRCKIEAKLVVITNRKSHMSFRLVPKSVTLDDLERRSNPNRRNFTEFGSFRGGLRKSGWRYTDTFCSGNVGHVHITCGPQTARTWIQSITLFGGALQQMVYQRRRFKTINQLKKAIVTEWGKLLEHFIDGALAPFVSGITGLSGSSRSKANKFNIWFKNCSMWVTLDNNWDNKHVVPCC